MDLNDFMIRRAIISIGLFLCGLFLAFGDFRNRSRFLCAAFVYGGFILIGLGLMTWWVTFAFLMTWNWPL